MGFSKAFISFISKEKLWFIHFATLVSGEQLYRGLNLCTKIQPSTAVYIRCLAEKGAKGSLAVDEVVCMYVMHVSVCVCGYMYGWGGSLHVCIYTHKYTYVYAHIYTKTRMKNMSGMAGRLCIYKYRSIECHEHYSSVGLQSIKCFSYISVLVS
jgi:hypothetical protein